MERKRRDLPVTLYRILLYLSRMRDREGSTRRLIRIERATGIDRKELRLHLSQLTEHGAIESIKSGRTGRGGHPEVVYAVTEIGRSIRIDLGRWIDLGVRLEYYPESFFYLPSDDLGG